MPDFSGLTQSPYFREGVFIFAVLLFLGAYKVGLEGVLK